MRISIITLSLVILFRVEVALGQSLPINPAAGADAATPAQPAAGTTGLLARLFGKTAEQRVQCRVRFANSPAGQLLNGLLKPLQSLTGGLLKPVGANQPDPAAAKKPADSPAGAKARIQAEEALAAEKIAALEYLGTKDCRRYPEAEAALINGLRAEPQECVRLSAAKALLSGCCCTAKVMKALTICVNESKADGNLPEESERVRLVAFAALQKCVRSYRGPAEEPPEKPRPALKVPEGDGVKLVGYTPSVEGEPEFAAAKAALSRGVKVSPATARRLARGDNLQDFFAGVAATPAESLSPPPEPLSAPLAPPTGAATTTVDRSLTGIINAAFKR